MSAKRIGKPQQACATGEIMGVYRDKTLPQLPLFDTETDMTAEEVGGASAPTGKFSNYVVYVDPESVFHPLEIHRNTMIS